MALQFTVWYDASEVAMGDPLQEGTIAIGGASTQGDVIDGGGGHPKRHRFRVRVFCEANAYVTWGANPTALSDGTDGRMMGSENPEYFNIENGHKIAVIQRS